MSSTTPSQMAVDSPLVSRVRVAINSHQPLVTRVVMEIAATTSYHVENARRGRPRRGGRVRTGAPCEHRRDDAGRSVRTIPVAARAADFAASRRWPTSPLSPLPSRRRAARSDDGAEDGGGLGTRRRRQPAAPREAAAPAPRLGTGTVSPPVSAIAAPEPAKPARIRARFRRWPARHRRRSRSATAAGAARSSREPDQPRAVHRRSTEPRSRRRRPARGAAHVRRRQRPRTWSSTPTSRARSTSS